MIITVKKQVRILGRRFDSLLLSLSALKVYVELGLLPWLVAAYVTP